MELTLTADGQVTFARELMEHLARLGAKAGSRLSVTKTPEGLNISTREQEQKISVSQLQERLEALNRAHDNGIYLTLDEIQQAVADAYVAHGTRGLK